MVFGDAHSHLEEVFHPDNDFDTNDYWLIQINDVLDDDEIRMVLQNVTLKYNSLTFLWGYIDDSNGKEYNLARLTHLLSAEL